MFVLNVEDEVVKDMSNALVRQNKNIPNELQNSMNSSWYYRLLKDMADVLLQIQRNTFVSKG